MKYGLVSRPWTSKLHVMSGFWIGGGVGLIGSPPLGVGVVDADVFGTGAVAAVLGFRIRSTVAPTNTAAATITTARLACWTVLSPSLSDVLIHTKVAATTASRKRSRKIDKDRVGLDHTLCSQTMEHART